MSIKALLRNISFFFLCLLGISIVSLFLVPIENRIVWGYWFSRPTFQNELKDIDELLGVSAFKIQTDGVVLQPKDWKRSLELAERICIPPTNECLDERLLLALEPKLKLGSSPPEVDEVLLGRSWREALRQGWRPEVNDPQYIKSGFPVAGRAIHFRKGQAEKILIAYYTGEFSNDRHGYAEVLYDVNGPQLKLSRQIHFFFEIAGLEFLTWRVFFIINLGLFIICLLAYEVVRKLKGTK